MFKRKKPTKEIGVKPLMRLYQIDKMGVGRRRAEKIYKRRGTNQLPTENLNW